MPGNGWTIFIRRSLGGVRFAAAPGASAGGVCAAPRATSTSPSTGATMWVFVWFAVCSPSLEKREDGKKKEVRKMGRLFGRWVGGAVGEFKSAVICH
jgi:hypothetical protein